MKRPSPKVSTEATYNVFHDRVCMMEVQLRLPCGLVECWTQELDWDEWDSLSRVLGEDEGTVCASEWGFDLPGTVTFWFE